jgi:hypothetical protein
MLSDNWNKNKERIEGGVNGGIGRRIDGGLYNSLEQGK